MATNRAKAKKRPIEVGEVYDVPPVGAKVWVLLDAEVVASSPHSSRLTVKIGTDEWKPLWTDIDHTAVTEVVRDGEEEAEKAQG
ncbi:MAG: hypothetical protein AAGI37_19740 [Planctomycetota bacterium]